MQHWNVVTFFKLILLVHLIVFSKAWGQLSPGDLAEPHAHLEGIKYCTECHTAGKRIASKNCLACHVLIKERRKAGLGLHARQEYKKCINCHNDHLGLDFALIHWKEKKENFDHSQTGYILEDAHSKIECNSCHQPDNIIDQEKLTARKKDLKRTFLGLSQECLSCHIDEHRKQLSKDCMNCHNYKSWKPAPGFDHNQTKFSLKGKHIKVKCEKCHKQIIDNLFAENPSYFRFKGIKYRECSACHKDVHSESFGRTCSNCHQTTGWRVVKMTQLDHSKTRFPLEGKHFELSCENCHKAGQSFRDLKFGQCVDCHTDYHQGDFKKRLAAGACEECHTVQGFAPSTFTIANHKKTDFPLAGGHLAIPCIACHAQEEKPDSASDRFSSRRRFKYESTRCRDCHNDPHFGDTEQFIRVEGCGHCHNVNTWRKTKFDHNETKFVLLGSHKNIACTSCHKPEDVKSGGKQLGFKGLSTFCQDCHKDIHQGQFTITDYPEQQTPGEAVCIRCHTYNNWTPDKFDHNRDAQFKLEGAHQSTDCLKCHLQQEKNGSVFAVYKPLETSCTSCHGVLK